MRTRSAGTPKARAIGMLARMFEELHHGALTPVASTIVHRHEREAMRLAAALRDEPDPPVHPRRLAVGIFRATRA